MQTKLSLLLALTVSIAMVGTSWVLSREVEAALTTDALRQATGTAQLAAQLVGYFYADAQRGLGDLAAQPDRLQAALADDLGRASVRPTQRILVVDRRFGTIAGSSDRDEVLQASDSLGLPAVWEEGQVPEARLVTATNGRLFLVGYAAAPALPWVIVVAEPYADALGPAMALRQRSNQILVVAVALAALVGWLLGRRLARPLAELRAAAERAAQAAAAREALLNRINARVRASLDVDAVLRATVEELGEALGAARCCLHLLVDGIWQISAYEWTRPDVVPFRTLALLPPRGPRLAVRERRTYAFADLLTDTTLDAAGLGPPPNRQATGTRALIATPLLVGDTALGAISIHAVGAPREWTADEIALAEGVAGEAAVALTNARLYAEAERRAERLAAVARVNRAISARLELGRLVEVVGEAIGQLVPFDRLALLRLEADCAGYQVLGALWRVPPAWDGPARAGFAGTRLEQMVRERRTVVCADLAAPDGPRSPREQQMLAAGLRCHVMVPILAEPEAPAAARRVIGALTLISRTPSAYGPAELALLDPIADQLAVALQNAGLYAAVVAGQRRLATVIAGIADGVLVLDAQGRVALSNAAAERLLGPQGAACVGQPWPTVLHELDAAGRALSPACSALGRAIAAGGACDLEVPVGRDGEPPRWLHVSVSPMAADEGWHLALVLRDVSAYKAVEQLKSDFVATVSHELRTPLASIKGYAATLRWRRDQLPGEVAEEYLTIINQEADRLGALVTDLLDVARLERHPAALACVPTALAPLAERVAGLARVHASHHQIVVAVPPRLHALAAPERLERVLINLLDNALKYSPRGGEVRVTAEPDADTVRLVVADRGLGIPADRQADLFRPFSRVEHVLTRQTEGAGLGLYICKQLVERMGGSIALDSTPGAGTVVTVTLRTAPAAAAASRA